MATVLVLKLSFKESFFNLHIMCIKIQLVKFVRFINFVKFKLNTVIVAIFIFKLIGVFI